jgi:hypothetical protein
LGKPPKGMNKDTRACWLELQAIVPQGYMTAMDRPAAELLCSLWAKQRKDKLMSTQQRLLSTLFTRFGLTPADRSLVRRGGTTPPAPQGTNARPKNRFAALNDQ